MKPDKKNIMVVLSSPSGAGKTTITKKIQQKFNTFKISVSHTTRKPRLNEIDGIDYNFISTADYAWNFKPIPFLILFLICIIMIPIQTSAEEYLFMWMQRSQLMIMLYLDIKII